MAPVMRSLHKGPGQVFVAVLLVALALVLAVAKFLGFHTAGIGGIGKKGLSAKRGR
jgi:hypothetical protein